MPSSLTSGSSIIVSVQNSDVDIGLRHGPKGSALPMFPQSVSRGARLSGFPGSHFCYSVCYSLSGCLPPCTDRTGTPSPSGAFTSRLSTVRLPFPLLDMTTTVTGLLCWRDFHPLEWQLASLHQIRTCGFPAYGSCLGCVTAQVAVYAPAPVTREPGPEPSACFAGAYSPWPPPFAPPTPLRPPPQTPPQWAFLALFAGFIATMTRSDFSCPCIIGFGSSPSRCGPSLSRDSDGQTRDLPASGAILLHVMWPSTPAGRQHLA